MEFNEVLRSFTIKSGVNYDIKRNKLISKTIHNINVNSNLFLIYSLYKYRADRMFTFLQKLSN